MKKSYKVFLCQNCGKEGHIVVLKIHFMSLF